LALLSIFGRPLMGLIHDKFKGTTAAAIFLISAAAGFICLTKASNITFLWIAVILWGLNSGLSLIMPPLWTAALFGTKDFASIVSWTVTINRLGSAFGGYLINWLFDITGNNNLIWPICSGLLLLSLVGIVYSLTKTKKQSEAYAAQAAH